MSSETIFDRIREKPFKSFRLRVSDGSHYDVEHPEMIKLMKQRVIIFIYEDPAENFIDAERSVIISPLHITSIEDLPPRRSRKKSA
jgi:hypothetical protein